MSARALEIAKRSRPITGVSEFPNPDETLPERRPYAEPLDVHRYAGEFEALRDDRASIPVFLATMGTVAAYTARATFAANLLASGGVDTVTAGPTEGVEEVVAAYSAASSTGRGTVPVVCLAGTDKAYESWGGELITALRAAGARYVVAAGKNALDVDATAAAGQDALAFLRTTREELVT